MVIFNKKAQSRSGMNLILWIAGLFILLSFMTFPLAVDLKANEDNMTKKDAQGDSSTAEHGNKEIVTNRYGTEMGSIDDEGNIFNIYGSLLGSVDGKGNIFNVSKINIGRVTKEGTILNQSETILGSVNASGEIFNVSGIKMGEVKGDSDFNRTGGAARLIFLK